HIDSYKIVQLVGAPHNPPGHIDTRPGVELQSELGEFDRNRRIDFPARDLFQHVQISLSGAMCLIESVDVFAEYVECGAKSPGVKTAHDGESFIDSFAGDVPVCHSPDNGLRNDRQRVGNGSIQQGHTASTSGIMKKLLVA